MEFTVQIHSENAALVDDPEGEISRILRNLADRVEAGEVGGTVRLNDINGNPVGIARLAA